MTTTAPTVLISGAASGIGRAIATRFARDGSAVAIADLDGEGAEGVARELRATGARASGHRCDVRDPAQCRAVVDAAVAAHGRIDVVVNNAGISHRSRFVDTDPEVLRRVMDVNLFGAVHLTQAALPQIVEHRGVIVAISSVAGFAPLVGRTGYAASKHALHGLFDSLRAELAGTGVAVVLVCPGFTDTAIDRHALGADGAAATTSKQVVGRLARPEEVADAVADAVRRRARLTLVGRVARASFLLARWAPRAFERLMRRRAAE
jgi:NAD(P)-dependent dehydrogenase (short-subunit alcohol dehydrogenase family)